LRGREEIARLTARLRSEHDEYESASSSWSPEAGEKKKELRKARADTLVEIGAALTWLGEVELFREIERLPFEQKLVELEAFLEDAQGGSAAPSREGSAPLPDALPHSVAEPSIARPEPEPTPEEPRAVSDLPRPAPMPRGSMRPRSMRPRSRRPAGHWPVSLVPSAMPRTTTWRVPLLVGVIALQGLALTLLSIAVLRITPRTSESDPSRAATSNATAAAMATPVPSPSPAPQSASALPIVLPAAEPHPTALAETPRRTAPPPRPPPRSKPTSVPSPPALARRPEIFVPDTL
jgi:hypothetical protein